MGLHDSTFVAPDAGSHERTAQLPVRHSVVVRHAWMRVPPPPVQSRWHAVTSALLAPTSKQQTWATPSTGGQLAASSHSCFTPPSAEHAPPLVWHEPPPSGSEQQNEVLTSHAVAPHVTFAGSAATPPSGIGAASAAAASIALAESAAAASRASAALEPSAFDAEPSFPLSVASNRGLPSLLPQ